MDENKTLEDEIVEAEAEAEAEAEEEFTSAEHGDYSPSNPWDAPGMRISDFFR